MVRHILISLLRTRDDNLILVNTSLFASILLKLDSQTLHLTQLTNFDSKDQVTSNLLNSLIALILVDPPFRGATIKSVLHLIKILHKPQVDLMGLVNEENSKGFFACCAKTCANLRKIISINNLSEIVLNHFEKDALGFE